MPTTFRNFQNKPGSIYNPLKLDVPFAEDLNLLATAINALENVSHFFDPNVSGPFIHLGLPDNAYQDENTGIIWQEYNAVTYFDFDSASIYAQYLDADGVMVDGTPQNIWRLPTVKEWQSVLDYSMQSPATALPNTQSDYYWSGTEYAPYTFRAWFVYTSDGNVGNGYKNDIYLVRCVR